MQYIKKQWEKFTQKTLFGKASDILFVLLIIAMLIPASRKQISAFTARLIAMNPSVIDLEKQKTLSASEYQWEFTDMQGNTVSLSDFEGKPVFLNFWATWCPPCIAEMPDIQKLYDRFGEQAAFILISDEDPQQISQFMQKRGFNMPVYIHKTRVPALFASSSIPTTFVISPEGGIIIQKTGAAKWNSKKMVGLMTEMLQQKD
ncbi:MAG: TlpA disulfide reductase family protein [Bacteroidales bacterium]|nr:TlpA disulfide reductase family protein [Bacteroidales bacterium]